MFRRGLLLLTLTLALPALAGFGPERPASPHDLVTYKEGRAHVRIASNGDGFLVAWRDIRGGAVGVYGTRVAADGTLLDAPGFLIAQAEVVDLVWSGTHYVAVWQHPKGGLLSRTISTGGQLGEPRLALEAPAGRHIAAFAIAGNGATILVATSLGIGSLLESDGALIGQMSLAAQAASLYSGIAVASAGDEYLVASGNPGGVVTQRVSNSGQPSPPVTIEGSPRGAAVALATDGRHYLVVSTVNAVTAQLVSRAGEPVGTIRTIASAHSINGFEYPTFGPSATWRDGEYVVTYGQQNETELFAVRVASNGGALGAPSKFGESFHLMQGEARVAARGGNGAAVWIDRASVVQFARFGDRTAIAPSQPLSYTGAPQTHPTLVRAGNRVMAAWLEKRTSGSEIRVGQLGGEFKLVAEVNDHYYFYLDLLFDGETVWVLWLDDAINVRRFTTALEPIDAAPLTFERKNQGMTRFAAAAGRNGILVALGSFEGLHVTALHAEGGSVVATDTVVPPQSFEYHHPAAAWDGERYVLAFAHALGSTWWQFPEPVPNEVLVTRVSREGLVLDAEPIVVSRENAMDIDVVGAARGADGAIAIAWQDGEDRTFLARFTGAAKPPAVGLPSRGGLQLGPVVPVSGGYVVFRHTLTDVQYERLALDLTPRGEAELFPAFPHFYQWDPFYDATAIGAELTVAYVRSTVGEQSGGVPRVFWRASDGAPHRRRAVR